MLVSVRPRPDALGLGKIELEGIQRKRTLNLPNAAVTFLGNRDGFEVYEETNLSTGSKRRDYFYQTDEGSLVHAVQTLEKVTVSRKLRNLDLRYIYDVDTWADQKSIDAAVLSVVDKLYAEYP